MPCRQLWLEQGWRPLPTQITGGNIGSKMRHISSGNLRAMSLISMSPSSPNFYRKTHGYLIVTDNQCKRFCPVALKIVHDQADSRDCGIMSGQQLFYLVRPVDRSTRRGYGNTPLTCERFDKHKDVRDAVALPFAILAADVSGSAGKRRADFEGKLLVRLIPTDHGTLRVISPVKKSPRRAMLRQKPHSRHGVRQASPLKLTSIPARRPSGKFPRFPLMLTMYHCRL